MANDISIDADFVINEQPDIQADLHINFSPDISNLVTREELAEDLADKQDVLTAGANIQIEDNVISATDTTYTAGEGISIVDNVISNTQTSAEWGNIQGDIADQTDLTDLIDTKIEIEATARENNDLALQNGINTLNDDLTAEISNRGTADGILQGNIDTLSGIVTSNYTTLDGKISDNKTAIDNHIADKTNPHEVSKAQVGLGNVDNTSDLNKPISTATQQALDGKVPTSRTVNSKALTSDITLTASDVGALPDSTTIGNGTLTIQKNGSTIDTFGANDTGNTTVNITVPTDTSDLTNNAGFITGINSTDVTTALGYTPYDSTNPDGYTDNVGTVTSVNNAQPDSNGNVTLSIPAAQVNSDWNASSGVAQILNKPTLSTVATTGDYDDLTNKPTIPTKTSDLTNDSGFIPNTATGDSGLTILGTANSQTGAINIGASSSVTTNFGIAIGYNASSSNNFGVAIGNNAEVSGSSSLAIGYDADVSGTRSIQIGEGTNNTNFSLAVGFGTFGEYQLLNGVTGLIPDARISSNIARTSDLSTVATSGSYNDLSDKPTIPAAQVQSNWNETDTDSKAYIQNKPSLSTVATSGNYNDLSNKPTIPTVNNATLTITQGGTTKGTFTANAGTDVTIDLDAGGGSSTDVQINGTSITSGGVADIITEGVYDATDNKIATMSDLAGKQDVLTAGTNISIVSAPPIPPVDTRSTATVSTVGNKNWQEVAYLNGKYIAVGNDGYVVISDDGETWGTPYKVGSNTWRGIAYGNNTYFICGNSGNVAYSTDGENWTTTTVGTAQLNDVQFLNNKFIMGSRDSLVRTSSDGVTWSSGIPIAASFFGPISQIAYGNGLYVTGGNSGKIATSTDGETWTTTTVGNNQWLPCIYANNKFVVCGTSGKYTYSTDGVNWETPQQIPDLTSTIQEIVYSGGYFIAVCEDGYTSTSIDGETWTTPVRIGTSNWYGLACNGNDFVAVGTSGKVTNFEIAPEQDGGTIINGAEIVSAVDSTSTNSECVGAKLFYDTVGDIETALNTINSGVSA